jgi:hypothetical protein
MRPKWLFLIPLVLMGIVAFTALGGWVVMSLWNWLLPPLFGWHTVTLWQALGLLVLCRILFGGFGMQNNARSRMGERWGARSPEERERIRQRMREKFGFGPRSGEGSEG